jgi:hypothetical protein
MLSSADNTETETLSEPIFARFSFRWNWSNDMASHCYPRARGEDVAPVSAGDVAAFLCGLIAPGRVGPEG